MPDRGFRSGSSRSEPITLTPRRSAWKIWIRFGRKRARCARFCSADNGPIVATNR